MSMKLLIFVKGAPIVNGYRRMEFEWSVPHKLYLFKGRELEASEFNVAAERVFNSPIYRNMFPSVMIAPGSVQAPAPAPEEITLDKALGVVERYAPHRLKKKPGPKEELVPA